MQKIPRPMNCFLLFRHDKQKEILTQCPGANHRDISKIIAKWWKEATEQEKAPYVERARKEKMEHARLYPSYKYMPQKKSRGKPRAYKRKTQNEFTSKSEERNKFMKMIYQNRDALNNSIPSPKQKHYNPILISPTPSFSSSISSLSTSPILNSSYDSSSTKSLLTKIKKSKKDKSINNKSSSSVLSLQQYPSPIYRSPSPLQHVYFASTAPLQHIPYNTFYESLPDNNNSNNNSYITNDINTYNSTNLTTNYSNNNNNSETDNHPHPHHPNYINKPQLSVNEFYLDHASSFYNLPPTQFTYSMATPPPTFTNYVYTNNNTLLNTTTTTTASSMGYQEIALDLPIYPNNHCLF
ncbi:unnamed protein product [Cunninghamella blakesleeana]